MLYSYVDRFHTVFYNSFLASLNIVLYENSYVSFILRNHEAYLLSTELWTFEFGYKNDDGKVYDRNRWYGR